MSRFILAEIARFKLNMKKKGDKKICDEENPAFPGGSRLVEPAETQFSKIPDFRGMNLKTQPVTVIEPAEISAGKKTPGKRTAGRR